MGNGEEKERQIGVYSKPYRVCRNGRPTIKQDLFFFVLFCFASLEEPNQIKGVKEMVCVGVFVYLCVSGTLCGVWTRTHTPDDPPAAPAPPAVSVCDAHTRS